MRDIPQAALALFRRYRELPSPVLLHTLFDGDDTAFRNGMKKIRPHCDATVLTNNVKSYRLTSAAASRHGVSQNRKPPNQKQLKQLVATACHCLLSTPTHMLITRAELRDHFRELYTDDFRTSRYYFETSADGSPVRIVSLLIDTGKSIHGLLKDNRKDVARHIERVPAYRRLALQEHRISVRIATTTPTRATDLSREFAKEQHRYEFWRHVPVDVVADDTYAQLMSVQPLTREAA